MIHTVRNNVETVICPFYNTEDKFNLILAIVTLIMNCIYTIYSTLDNNFTWFYFWFFILAFVMFFTLHVVTRRSTGKPQIILRNGILNYKNEEYIEFSNISSVKKDGYTCIINYYSPNLNQNRDLYIYYGDDDEIPNLIIKLIKEYAENNHFDNIEF